MIPDLGQLKKNYVKENQLILKYIYIYIRIKTQELFCFSLQKSTFPGERTKFL